MSHPSPLPRATNKKRMNRRLVNHPVARCRQCRPVHVTPLTQVQSAFKPGNLALKVTQAMHVANWAGQWLAPHIPYTPLQLNAQLNGLHIDIKKWKGAELLQKWQTQPCLVWIKDSEYHHELFIYGMSTRFLLSVELFGKKGVGLWVQTEKRALTEALGKKHCYLPELTATTIGNVIASAMGSFGPYNVLANSCQHFAREVGAKLGLRRSWLASDAINGSAAIAVASVVALGRYKDKNAKENDVEAGDLDGSLGLPDRGSRRKVRSTIPPL